MTTQKTKALHEFNKEEKQVEVLQRLIRGELEAEGRFIHEDMTEAEQINSPFVSIPREAWVSYDVDFDKSLLSACPFLEVGGGAYRQENYRDIVIFVHEDQKVNKGGRKAIINNEILFAQIATYFVVTKPDKIVCPTDGFSKFKEEMLQKIPYLYELVTANNLVSNKTAERQLKKFSSIYKTAEQEFDKYEEN